MREIFPEGLKTQVLANSLDRSGVIKAYFQLINSSYMGRPPVLPKKKKDGYYIEIRNKGAKSGTIIIRDSEQAMMQAARQYQTTKDVIILGKHENGKRVEEGKKKVKA